MPTPPAMSVDAPVTYRALNVLGLADMQLVFLGILAIGLVFEGIWYLMHRTNAVTSAQTGPAPWSAAQRQNKGGL